MKKRDIIAQYVRRFPNVSSRALARSIYEREKPLFNNIESVNWEVRYVRGRIKTRIKHSPIHNNDMKRSKNGNPYNLPDSYESEIDIFDLPLSDNNILVLSDLHIPYHTISACNAAIQYGIDNKCNTILINGDLIDFHGLSRFEKDPRKRTVKAELDSAQAFLASIRKVFPKSRIYWLKGNHDIRYEKWLMTRVVELYDDEYYQLEVRLNLEKYRIKIIEDKTIIKAGKLNILHGHTIIKGIFMPVNVARGVFLKTKQPTLIGHTHKVSEHTETPLNTDIITCWSAGCLCELTPDYNPHCNNFAHGFANVIVHKDKSFSVKNFRILNGKIL